mmetsp:Transcript_16121/g.46489  ORF Transcript_16121/g.46489 Transcript_16121/m.46489 type:complete len:233 (-) Transcript_16121:645-1343(-)
MLEILFEPRSPLPLLEEVSLEGIEVLLPSRDPSAHFLLETFFGPLAQSVLDGRGIRQGSPYRPSVLVRIAMQSREANRISVVVPSAAAAAPPPVAPPPAHLLLQEAGQFAEGLAPYALLPLEELFLERVQSRDVVDDRSEGRRAPPLGLEGIDRRLSLGPQVLGKFTPLHRRGGRSAEQPCDTADAVIQRHGSHGQMHQREEFGNDVAPRRYFDGIDTVLFVVDGTEDRFSG